MPPAPYKSDDLTPQREGRRQENPQGPVLQSMSSKIAGGGQQQAPQQQGQRPQQGQQPDPTQEAASGWERFFGYLRENPDAIAFLANASQAALDPNAAGDPSAALRAGFQGMANYRTILHEMQRQRREGDLEERRLELESTRVEQGGERNELARQRLEQEGELSTRRLDIEEEGLGVEREKVRLAREKLQRGETLSIKEKEEVYSSIYERHMEMIADPITGELPEGGETRVRMAANAEALQTGDPSIARFDPHWSEDTMDSAAEVAVRGQHVNTFAREVYLDHGPEAMRVFLRKVREKIQQQGQETSTPDPEPAPEPAPEPEPVQTPEASARPRGGNPALNEMFRLQGDAPPIRLPETRPLPQGTGRAGRG